MVDSYLIVLSITKVSENVTIKREILEILKSTVGDEILFILDKNKNVNIRKYPSQLMPGEKFLSSSTISGERIPGKYPAKLKPGKKFYTDISEVKIPRRYFSKFHINFPKDVANILEIGEEREILWILNEDGNIFIKNTFLISKCAKKIFNRNVSAMILGLTKINADEGTVISKEIVEIINADIGKPINFFMNEFDNIIVSTTPLPYRLLGTSKLYDERRYHVNINLNIRNILKVDIGGDILWILDEEGNIIIKDTILPENCLKKK